jgi:hypothetical protein
MPDNIFPAVDAELLLKRRIILAESVFAELVIWRLPRTLPGSAHPYKYRLALVADGLCVLRYDNEAGKGDTSTAALARLVIALSMSTLCRATSGR